MAAFDSFLDALANGESSFVIKKYFGDNPLFTALKLGEHGNCPLEVVKELLLHGAEVNYSDESGDSCLHMAVKNSSDEEVIHELLERGADVNKRCTKGFTPLLVLLSRKECSAAFVRLLIEYGADVNCEDVHGETALATATRNSKDDSVVQILLEAGAKLGNADCLNTLDTLYILLEQGENCSSDMVKLFLRYGADVNFEYRGGFSPLAFAIKNSRNDEVIQALLEGGANVNKIFMNGYTPLLLLLWQCEISISTLKLLLDYKADVNQVSPDGDSPLKLAIKLGWGEGVIRALLDNGAHVDKLDRHGRSPLCIAFQYSSHDIIKMLLDAGCSLGACYQHYSPLLCATHFPKSGLREDILDRVLKVPFDIKGCDRLGQSVFCHALIHEATVHDLELLLKKGASIRDCREHVSPLLCATDGYILSESVLQLLLERGAGVEGNGWEILRNALQVRDYEVGAIQLLLGLPGMRDCAIEGNEGGKSILHFAVENSDCKLAVVRLLLDEFEVFKCGVVKNQETLLHSAVKNNECSTSVVKYLLKRGFPVNHVDEYGYTPLSLAVRYNGFKQKYNCGLIKELLIAGARIGEGKHCDVFMLLQSAARRYHYLEDENRHDFLKILVKFYFLQNPQLDFRDFSHASNKGSSYSWLCDLQQLVNDCVCEVKDMESFQIADEFTLCDFVRGYCLPDDKLPNGFKNGDQKNLKLSQFLKFVSCLCNETSDDHNTSLKNSVLDQLLIILTKNEFKVYFEVFVERVDRAVIETILSQMSLYTSKNSSSTGKLYLNEDVLSKISSFLSKESLLKFVLAYYISDKSECTNSLGSKRSFESTSKQHKFPKLY